ncbi:MAG: SRPBCC family protein [Chryseolinea sp.]
MKEEMKAPVNESTLLPPIYGTSLINVGYTERILSVAMGFALTTSSLKKLKLSSFPLLIAGGYMIIRGATGYCHLNTIIHRNTANKKSDAVEAEGSYIIEKPREEVYNYWRRLENLPLFMKHLAEVVQLDAKRSRWKVLVPGGFTTVSWDAEIVEDKAGEYISWSSLPGSTIDNAGSVSFVDAPGGTTQIKARIAYRLPGGDAGSLAAKLINPIMQAQLLGDLERFKHTIEGDTQFITEKANSARNGKLTV